MLDTAQWRRLKLARRMARAGGRVRAKAEAAEVTGAVLEGLRETNRLLDQAELDVRRALDEMAAARAAGGSGGEAG